MTRWPHSLVLVVLLLALAACNDPPLSWDTVVARKIREQYPSYQVDQPAPGQLVVQRPGSPPATVDVTDIALRCRRGLPDCNTALESMLLDLR